MIALNHRSGKVNLGEDLKRLQSEIETTQSDAFVSFLKFVKSIVNKYHRRRAIRIAISLNKKLHTILSGITIDSEVNEDVFKRTRDLLGRIKEMRETCNKASLNTPKLAELFKQNIQLAYKIEKEVRTRLYSNQKGEISDLAKSATSISTKNIGEHLYAN